MSRAFNLAMTEEEILKHCASQNIDISALETLPNGGVRMVCKSSYGAAQIRLKLKRQIINGEVPRARFRPRSPLW